MNWKLLLVFLVPLASFLAQLSLVKVEPGDWACEHRKRIRGDPESLFQFLVSPHVLERLLPWLKDFREADGRIISAGKSYSAVLEVPLLGERAVRAVLTDYRPSKLLVFEFSDDFGARQRIVVQARSYHDRTLLHTTVYFQRPSLLYQATIGYLLRRYVKSQLEKSMRIVALTYERLDPPEVIPDLSKLNPLNNQRRHSTTHR